MVEPIINVRSLICWRGRRELDNGRQKTRNHGYDVIVGGELFTDYPITSQTCHAKPKLKSTGAGRHQLLSCWWMPTASSLAWKTSPKSQTLYCSRLRSVALYLWLIVVISVRQSTVAVNIWASLPKRWLCTFEHKADSLIAKFKAWAERSERLMYEQSHRDYSAHYLHHRLPVMGC